MIGFVGLVVPHLVRLMIGLDHRLQLPVSALAGGSPLLLADLLARLMLAPAELPIVIDRIMLLADGCARLTGTPEQVLRAELLKSVFGLDVLVQQHPERGHPLVIAR